MHISFPHPLTGFSSPASDALILPSYRSSSTSTDSRRATSAGTTASSRRTRSSRATLSSRYRSSTTCRPSRSNARWTCATPSPGPRRNWRGGTRCSCAWRLGGWGWKERRGGRSGRCSLARGAQRWRSRTSGGRVGEKGGGQRRLLPRAEGLERLRDAGKLLIRMGGHDD